MQHLFVANQKRLFQGCKNAGAHSSRVTKKFECANFFVYFLYFMHMKAAKHIFVRYQKFLRPTNIHRKMCTPGLVTRFQ